MPADLPEPAAIVVVSPPAEGLDAVTRSMVLELVRQGETVLLCSRHKYLRDKVKHDFARWLSRGMP
jgi:hypothetical protein